MVSWPSCCTGGFVGEMTKEEGWVGGKKLGSFLGECTEAGLPKDRFDGGGGTS